MATALETVLYEIATRTLPRVALREDPRIQGLLLEDHDDKMKILVHWGVQDRVPVETWHYRRALVFPEETNGHVAE